MNKRDCFNLKKKTIGLINYNKKNFFVFLKKNFYTKITNIFLWQ